jgi:hypothetical protein
MEQLPSCAITTHNYAAASPNRVHDDTAARALGYEGALVPGVAVFAYLVCPVMKAHGMDWLNGGRLTAQFHKPVYANRNAVASGQLRANAKGYDLQLSVGDGTVCATGIAENLTEVVTPSRPQPEGAHTSSDRLLAPSIAALLPGTLLTPLERPWTECGWRGEFEGDFSAQMGNLPPFSHQDAHCWHPAYPLYLANALLMSNIDLGLWIHTGSDVWYRALPKAGKPLRIEGWVSESGLRRDRVWIRVVGIVRGGDDAVCACFSHEALVGLRAY